MPFIEQLPLMLPALTLPLAGWSVHVRVLHRRLAAAARDPLTGLLRRDTYTNKARQILHRHDDTVVVMVDLDHFKAVNDALGHAAGDAVLIAAGKRLTDWAGTGAAVGRLGGDEFAVVLQLPNDRREVRLAQLVKMLSLPVVLDDGQPIDVAASVGAATPDVVGGRDLAQLQRAADAALYDGKHSGQAVLATPKHTRTPSINGRRAGRPGTAAWGRAAERPASTRRGPRQL